MTPVDSIKDVVRSSVKVHEFDKHLKKARGHIGRNVVEITIKIAIVQKPFMMKNSLNCHNVNCSNFFTFSSDSFIELFIYLFIYSMLLFASLIGKYLEYLDRGSILGQVISKTQKMVLDTALRNTQYYKVRIKGNPGNGVATFCTTSV